MLKVTITIIVTQDLAAGCVPVISLSIRSSKLVKSAPNTYVIRVCKIYRIIYCRLTRSQQVLRLKNLGTKWAQENSKKWIYIESRNQNSDEKRITIYNLWIRSKYGLFGCAAREDSSIKRRSIE